MRRKHKIKRVRGDKKVIAPRGKIAPPSIRHDAKKGTGYNRRQEKKEFRDELRQEY